MGERASSSRARELADHLASTDVLLALARVHPDALDMLERAGVIGAIGAEHVYERVADAVEGFGPEVQ